MTNPDPRPHMQGRPGEHGWRAVITELQRRNPNVIYTLRDARPAPSAYNERSRTIRQLRRSRNAADTQAVPTYNTAGTTSPTHKIHASSTPR